MPSFQRAVPPQARRELDKQESAEIYLVFLKIRHPALTEDIRVVSDPKNFILEDEEYQGFEFEIKILSDGEKPPSAQLSIQNVDRRIGEAILNSNDSIRLEIQIVTGSEFDLTVTPRTSLTAVPARVYRARQLYLTDIEGGLIFLTGTIRSWDYTQETWPGIRATQARLPGLYW